MAMQSGSAVLTPPEAAGWHAFHVHYHGDSDRVVRELVRPLAGELARSETVDRFYFVRYNLGGPHLRLRWRAAGGDAAAAAEAALARAAGAFFSRWPSRVPIAEEEVRRTNRALLRVDPLAQDETIYPDNSWRAAPLGFEVERYGGPDRLDSSLALFTLSTAAVFGVLGGPGDEAPSGPRARSAFLRLGLQLAYGLAGDGAEGLAGLAGYAARFLGGDAFAGCRAEGDAAFERRRGPLVEGIGRELARVDADGLAGAAALVASRLDGLDAHRRWHLGASHLHMTANRLGLTNPEEAYLSRMLERAVQGFREGDPDGWRRMAEGRAAFAERAARRSLDDRAASGLAGLAS
jgi:hypothetical protein